MSNELYAVQELEQEIELIAQQNDGEIPEEKFQELVEAQTKSLQKLEQLMQYTRVLEGRIELGKREIDRIKNLTSTWKNMIDGIKKYVTPYVKSCPNEKTTAGTFKIGIRKSTAVQLMDETELPKEYVEQRVEYKPDKNAIKKALKDGQEVPGARLVYGEHLQIK